MTILIFIVLIVVLVMVHELGHFITAKRNGVGAEEFGFGFPPRLIGIYKDKKGKRKFVFGNKKIEEEIKEQKETVYSINLLPLGGFVKIIGEDGQQEDKKGKTDEISFANKSIWIRFKILFAGVAMNFLLAFVLFSVVNFFGLPEIVKDNDNPSIPVTITMVGPKTPAEQAGLHIGDKIRAVIVGSRKITISSVEQLKEVINSNRGQKIELQIEREGVLKTVSVVPRENPPKNEGAIGVGLGKTIVKKYGFWQSIERGFVNVIDMTEMLLVALGRLFISPFTHDNIASEITGPIGIAKMSGQAASLGMIFLLNFMAMLSVNLAVINLLPFPGLDGGRILFLIIEKIKGHPIKQELEAKINTIGFVILLGLMLVVIIKDVLRFW